MAAAQVAPIGRVPGDGIRFIIHINSSKTVAKKNDI
jgi:hypothetical protein